MEEASRSATPEDLDVVADLVEAAITELEPTKGGAMWARREARDLPARPSLAAALDAPDQLVAVGTIDEVIVGYAVVTVETLRDGGRLALLSDIFVLPDARGVGVGETIMELVVEWSTERACVGIDSVALPGNRATKNFFETHGLVARSIIVHRRLR